MPVDTGTATWDVEWAADPYGRGPEEIAVEALLLASPYARFDFDPDQPRDSSGKWAKNSSSGHAAHLAAAGSLGEVHPTWGAAGDKKEAWGAVVVDDQGRFLLRKPTGNFGGYHWTLAKGRPDAGEHPLDTMDREVREETGHTVKAIAAVPGEFHGQTTVSRFFLAKSTGHDSAAMDSETEATRWEPYEKALELVSRSTTRTGRRRDRAVLESAQRVLKGQSELPKADGVAESMAMSHKARAALVAKYEAEAGPEVAERVRGWTRKWQEGKDSAGEHTTGGAEGRARGDYTPERKALHAEIAKKILRGDGSFAKPPGSSRPRLTMLGGAPASGKSSTLMPQIDESNTIIMDTDAIKQMLPEYDGENAVYLHKEAWHIGDAIIDYAVKRKLNLAIDGTLSDADGWRPFLEGASAKGYSTRGLHAAVPLEENLKRATSRYKETGRYVPLDVIASSYDKYQDGFDKLAQGGVFDKWEKHDGGANPRKIAGGGLGHF